MTGNDHVRFGPEVAGKGPALRAPRRRPTGIPFLLGTFLGSHARMQIVPVSRPAPRRCRAAGSMACRPPRRGPARGRGPRGRPCGRVPRRTPSTGTRKPRSARSEHVDRLKGVDQFRAAARTRRCRDGPAHGVGTSNRTGPKSPLAVDCFSNSLARPSYGPGHPGPFWSAQELRTSGDTR